MWSDPESGSQTDFASFVHFARTAERGLFDFLFLAEGLRLREHRGKIHDLDVVGRPDTLTVLNAIAAVTTHLGLGGTINTTFNEPYELARQFASLDHLSGGRAAWNLVTSSDAFTGENFRRGGFLKPEERYERAQEILDAAKALWLSDREPVEVRERAVHVRGPVHAAADAAGPPGAHPVRRLGRGPRVRRPHRRRDLLPARHRRGGPGVLPGPQGPDAALRPRPEEITILPATTFALGDTEAEARENAERVRREQVSPQTAIAFLEQVWGRDLSAYDPDGPLPDVEPDPGATITRGRVRHEKDPAGRRQGVARARRGQGRALDPRADHRDDGAAVVRRHPEAGRRPDGRVRAAGRLGRLHPRAAPRAAAAWTSSWTR